MMCPQHYLTEMQEVILFYNGLDVPTRQILDSRGVVLTKTAADAKTSIQEMIEYSQKWHNGTSRGRRIETFDGLAAIQAQLNNLRREIMKVNEKVYAAQEKDPGSFTLPCFINNFCFDNALVDLGASVSVMPPSTYLNLGLGELAPTRLTVELADRTVKYPKGIAENVLVGIGKFTFPIDFIILDMPEDVKVPLIPSRPFCLPQNQGDDLMPTMRKGEVIEEFRTRDEDLDTEIDDYPSYYDDDKKIYIDCAHNLKFSCMIGFDLLHPNCFPIIVSKDKRNGISHAYQKLKGFYKGVLNLGPDYIRDAKMEEWLTRGHISVHELE
ncbi:reverse transcriptase domain-containing protein [Tanacetum coccineum]